MHKYLISVGSNIKPKKNIERAHQIIDSTCNLIGASQPIETAPVGYQNQPNFLNCAFCVESELLPEAFRNFLKQVENSLGRVRGPIKSGPRTIDLDIVIIDGQVVDQSYYSQAYVREPTDELMRQLGLTIE